MLTLHKSSWKKQTIQMWLCNTNFVQTGNLKRHFATVHDGKKQFRFDICHTNFGQTVHEGNKQFKYDICNTNFGQNVSLNTHVTTVHEGKQEFKCDICNANFRQKGSLNTVWMLY